MRRGLAAVVAAAVLAGVALAGCGDEGGARTPRSPGTTLEGAERCAGIPADQQREEPIEVIHAFDGDDGANPWGSLVLLQDQLYGRTRVGGEQDNGVVFRVGLDGSGYEVMRSFTAGADNGTGNQPHHDHMSPVNGLLYSNTLLGGQGDHGVLFALDPATGEEQVVHEFQGAPGDGAEAHSGFLVTSRGMWIITAKGGANDQGALVRLRPETGRTELAYSFAEATGSAPHGRLVRAGEKMLFGMTREGGSAGAGVVFTFDPDARTYQVIHEFGPGPGNGEQPDHGFLVDVGQDQRLWGLTTYGGADGQGTVFSIGHDGSGFQVHHSFGSAPGDGTRPHGSLTLVGDALYGLTFEGGRWGVGSVFRIGTDGSGYEVVASFGGSETGAFPYDYLTAYQRKDRPPVLYGMTGNGGSNDPDCQQALGVIFRLDLERLAG